MPENSPSVPPDREAITLAGEHGKQVELDLLDLVAGAKLNGHASRGITIGEHGVLRLEVTPATLRRLAE